MAAVSPALVGGTGLGPAPAAALTHICHSGPGEEAALSEAPGQIRSISQRASITPGFPLWLMRKVGDGRGRGQRLKEVLDKKKPKRLASEESLQQLERRGRQHLLTSAAHRV